MNIGSRIMSETALIPNNVALISNNVGRTLLLAALFAASAGAQPTELSADQIVQKHVTALGGR